MSRTSRSAKRSELTCYPWWYLVLAALLTVVAFGGNALVVYLIATKHQLHNTANWIILSLSVADIAVSAGTIPTEYVFDVSEDKRLRYSLMSFFSAVSATNLCLMTLDRYIFIARPLRYISLMTTKTAVSLICLIWLMSLLPHLVFYLTQRPSSNGHRGTMNAAFIIADFVFFEIFPIVFQIAATGHIFHIVRKRSRQTAILWAQVLFNRRSESRREFLRQKQRNSSIKVTVAAVTTFLVCSLNKVAYDIVCEVKGDFCAVSHRFVTDILFLVNCSVNPVAYALFKTDIKNSFTSRLSRRRVQDSHNLSDTVRVEHDIMF